MREVTRVSKFHFECGGFSIKKFPNRKFLWRLLDFENKNLLQFESSDMSMEHAEMIFTIFFTGLDYDNDNWF